jgi:hypothetical protein
MNDYIKKDVLPNSNEIIDLGPGIPSLNGPTLSSTLRNKFRDFYARLSLPRKISYKVSHGDPTPYIEFVKKFSQPGQAVVLWPTNHLSSDKGIHIDVTPASIFRNTLFLDSSIDVINAIENYPTLHASDLNRFNFPEKETPKPDLLVVYDDGLGSGYLTDQATRILMPKGKIIAWKSEEATETLIEKLAKRRRIISLGPLTCPSEGIEAHLFQTAA